MEISDPLLGAMSLDRGQVHVCMARVHCTPGLEELVSSHEDRVEHGLAEEEVTHPLADDDVDLFGDLNALDGALDDLNHVRQLPREGGRERQVL